MILRWVKALKIVNDDDLIWSADTHRLLVSVHQTEEEAREWLSKTYRRINWIISKQERESNTFAYFIYLEYDLSVSFTKR